jgi:hypothetical protein
VSSNAKINLVVALLFVGAAVLGWFNVPMWMILLGIVGALVLAAVVFIVSRARQAREYAEHHRVAKRLIQRGDLQNALDQLVHYRNLDAELGVVFAPDIALSYALLGDVPAAQTSLADADERAGDQTRAYRAHTALVRAVIDCRNHRRAEAARALDNVWPICEAELTGQQLRPLRIVRAFAQSDAGAKPGGVIETALATVRPAYTGEHDYLGKAWPEMARYLADNGLSQ